MAKSVRQFTAAYRKTGKWYSAWIEEVPGVNTQGKTLREAKENLREALLLVLEANRVAHAKDASRGKTLREPVTISL